MRDESGYQGEITAEQLASLRPGSEVPPPQVDAALDCGIGPSWQARVGAAMRAGMEAA